MKINPKAQMKDKVLPLHIAVYPEVSSWEESVTDSVPIIALNHKSTYKTKRKCKLSVPYVKCVKA